MTPNPPAERAPMTEQCEFCEIDGYGNHAGRCPVQLESELAALQKLADIDREAHRGLGEENERLLKANRSLETALGQAREELERVRDAAVDESMNKILAMSDEQITALSRLEGHDPKDEATIARQAGELAMLTVDNDSLRERASAAEADAAQMRVLLGEWAHFIIWHKPLNFQDYACKECAPDAGMVKDGFQCAYHQAKALVNAPAIESAREVKP